MSSALEQIMRSIEQLTPPEQAKVLDWLEGRRKQLPAEPLEDWREKAERSKKSLRWLDEHRQEYLGQWVALDGDNLIASGTTAKEVYVAAKAAGVRVPFVELVKEAEKGPFWGGWD